MKSKLAIGAIIAAVLAAVGFGAAAYKRKHVTGC